MLQCKLHTHTGLEGVWCGNTGASAGSRCSTDEKLDRQSNICSPLLHHWAFSLLFCPGPCVLHGCQPGGEVDQSHTGRQHWSHSGASSCGLSELQGLILQDEDEDADAVRACVCLHFMRMWRVRGEGLSLFLSPSLSPSLFLSPESDVAGCSATAEADCCVDFT